MTGAEPLDRRVLGLFETPVMISRLPGAAELNESLKQVISSRRVGHPGISRSNTFGWHSDTGMAAWGGAPAMTLLHHLFRLCDLQTRDLLQMEGEPPRHAWRYEMWANASLPGASNQMHAHPGAIWSAVYYVDDGYAGSTDRSLGGELVLYDPRFPMNKMYAADFALLDSGGQIQAIEQVMRPAAGTMVVFPAWMMHAVRPYMGKGERLSVAINLMVVPAGRA